MSRGIADADVLRHKLGDAAWRPSGRGSRTCQLGTVAGGGGLRGALEAGGLLAKVEVVPGSQRVEPIAWATGVCWRLCLRLLLCV